MLDVVYIIKRMSFCGEVFTGFISLYRYLFFHVESIGILDPTIMSCIYFAFLSYTIRGVMMLYKSGPKLYGLSSENGNSHT